MKNFPFCLVFYIRIRYNIIVILDWDFLPLAHVCMERGTFVGGGAVALSTDGERSFPEVTNFFERK